MIPESPTDQSRYWLVNRYTTGWICGLHCDLNGFRSCISKVLDRLDNRRIKRRFLFITFLREPVARFLSEFEHVRRGATWKASRLTCRQKPIDLPNCYNGSDWKHVRLDRFMTCPTNLAINRMTLMLADLSLIDCRLPTINSSSDARIVLESAKRNLQDLAFFGLLDQQLTSQSMFEFTFNIRFRYSFLQLNRTHSTVAQQQLSFDTIDRIRKLNYLDVQLYEFAEQLLSTRLKLRALSHLPSVTSNMATTAQSRSISRKAFDVN
jgi:heparan sulfate 6-O-sulfotransferase HS6ST1